MESLKKEDFYGYKFISRLKYAPDGETAAFVVAEADPENNCYRRFIYLLRGEEYLRLTGMGEEGDFEWLDTKHILFAARRSPAEKKRAEAKERFTSYYRISIDGGEAEPYMTLPFEAQAIRPVGGDTFAVLGAIETDAPDRYQLSDKDRKAFDEERAKDADYEVLTELPYWHNGGGFAGRRRTALFTVKRGADAPEISRVTAPDETVLALEVTGGTAVYASRRYSALRPLKGFAITTLDGADGVGRVVYSSDNMQFEDMEVEGERAWLFMTDGASYGLNQNADIYQLDLSTGALRCVLAAQHAGHGLAGGSVGSDCRLGGGAECVAAGGALWHIYTLGGEARLARLTADGRDVDVIARPGSVDCVAVSPNQARVLFTALFDMKLQEIYCCEPDGSGVRQLTHFNDAALRDKYVAQPQPLSAAAEADAVNGCVLLPRDYDPAKRYPAVFDIHGGPKTVYGEVFYHEMQLWAGMGYFVFFCNPKGSDGGSDEFSDIRGDYGGQDYRDLMAFTDAVLQRWPQIDPANICVTGGSYGGFMTNWIIGHTQRFRCAASQRSISNWLSFYGVSDIGWYFGSDQTGANVYDSPEKMWAQSPLKYAANARTPTLFIHSDEDYRCPLEQGLQMYSALVEHGVEARLCLFHGENHELSRSGKPQHRLRRLTEITEWFEKHISRDAEAQG